MPAASPTRFASVELERIGGDIIPHQLRKTFTRVAQPHLSALPATDPPRLCFGWMSLARAGTCLSRSVVALWAPRVDSCRAKLWRAFVLTKKGPPNPGSQEPPRRRLLKRWVVTAQSAFCRAVSLEGRKPLSPDSSAQIETEPAEVTLSRKLRLRFELSSMPAEAVASAARDDVPKGQPTTMRCKVR
jgi:hypothetical protein